MRVFSRVHSTGYGYLGNYTSGLAGASCPQRGVGTGEAERGCSSSEEPHHHDAARSRYVRGSYPYPPAI